MEKRLACKCTFNFHIAFKGFAIRPCGGTDKSPLGHNPTGQKPTAKFGKADKRPLLKIYEK